MEAKQSFYRKLPKVVKFALVCFTKLLYIILAFNVLSFYHLFCTVNLNHRYLCLNATNNFTYILNLVVKFNEELSSLVRVT